MLLVGLTGRLSVCNFMPGFLQRGVTSGGSLDQVPLCPGRPKNYLEPIPKFVLGFQLPTTHFYTRVSEEWRKQIIGIVLPMGERLAFSQPSRQKATT